MLDKLTIDMFAPHLGEKFRLRMEPERVVEVELVQVTPLKSHKANGHDTARQQPFSILFRGPLSAIARQQIYPFEHDAMGTHEIFIVPIGPDQSGMLYEAIFT